MHPIRGTSRSAECRLRNPALDPSRQADWFLRLDGIPPICPDSVPNGEFNQCLHFQFGSYMSTKE